MSVQTVLVVARDHHVRTALGHLLRADGLDVRSASPESLATVAAEHSPTRADVVVVDLAGAPSSGALDAAVATGRPVVAIGDTPDERDAALAAGALTFLDRGAAPERVARAVRESAQADPAHSWRPAVAVALAGFVGPWTVWLTSIAEARGLLTWHLPRGTALWTMLPALLIALLATGGTRSLLDLGRRLVRWRVPARTYLAALTAPPAIAATAWLLLHLAGHRVPVGEVMSFRAVPGFLAFGTLLYLLTEEAVWRGALLPRVRERLGTASSGLVVGVVWALWHLPLLAVPGEHDAGLPVLGFLVLVVATSVLVTTLVEAAGGSVVVAAVFHAAFNASYSVAGVVGADRPMFWATTGLSVLVAAALLVRERGRGPGVSFAAGTRTPFAPLWMTIR